MSYDVDRAPPVGKVLAPTSAPSSTSAFWLQASALHKQPTSLNPRDHREADFKGVECGACLLNTELSVCHNGRHALRLSNHIWLALMEHLDRPWFECRGSPELPAPLRVAFG
jgi:hypothetical protein